MREFDALQGYPEPRESRRVDNRSIKSRIIASERGAEFFDGARSNGYGGLQDDGRWEPIAKSLAEIYGLHAGSSVLQVGAEKGFLLAALKRLGIGQCVGTEVSQYAIDKAYVWLEEAPYTDLPYEDDAFDLVLAVGPVYTLNLADAIKCLREVQRVGKQAFVTLGAYDTPEDERLFRRWSLLGCTILTKPDWVEVLKHAGYTGDYKFNTAASLRLAV